MELSPRNLARALPWLAAVLVVEVIVSLTPSFTGSRINFSNCMQALVHVPYAALLLGFAIGIFVMNRGGPTRTSSQRLLYGGFAAVAATAITQFMDISFTRGISRHWLMLQGLGNLLLNVAAPGIWGAAEARQENLQDSRIPLLGRAFGFLAMAGLCLYFVADLALIIVEGPMEVWKGTPGLLVVSTFVLLAARGPLLWAAIESSRPTDDEARAISRSKGISSVMALWFGFNAASWFFTLVQYRLGASIAGYSDPTMGLWRIAAQMTLLVTVTILMSLALEKPEMAYMQRPKGPFFPEPPPPADNSPIDVP